MKSAQDKIHWLSKSIHHRTRKKLAEIEQSFECIGLQERWISSYVSSIAFTALILQRKVSSIFAVYMVCLPQRSSLHYGYGSKLVRRLNSLPKIEGSK